jgi:hypothetical protein
LQRLLFAVLLLLRARVKSGSIRAKLDTEPERVG